MSFFFNSPDGTRLFDSNGWPVIGHIARVSVPSSALSFGSEFPFWSAKYIDITVSGHAPMIAVRVPSGLHPVGGYPLKVGGIYSTSRSGSSFTFRVYVFSTNSDWSFVYYVIDRMSVAHDGMGLTFWDPSGQVVFSTAVTYARPVASQSGGRTHAVVGFAGAAMTEDFIDDFNNPGVRYEITGHGFYEIAGHIYPGSKVIDGGVISGTAGPAFSGRDVGVSQPPLFFDVTDIEARS